MLPPWASPASLRKNSFTPVAEAATSGLKFTKLQPAREFYASVGTTLLDALESNSAGDRRLPRRRLRLLQNQSGFREVPRHQHHATLTDAEIADGYVLACSCHPQSDLVLA